MGFAEDLNRVCMVQIERSREIVKRTMLEVLSQCVERSPVGNPDLWKANQGAVAARDAYREEAFTYNAANPGKRRKGTSRQVVNKKFPPSAGKGYSGGRFKNNWQVGMGSINTTVEEAADASGSGSLNRAEAALGSIKLGTVIYVSNNLPYAKRLEFLGWSKQAPNGMVRLSLQNTGQAVKKAADEVRGT